MPVRHTLIFSRPPFCLAREERIIMVSLRKGILRINFGSESKARQVYEFAFLLNIVVIFAFYRVPIIAPATAVFMFVASFFVLMESGKSRIMIPYITIWYLTLILYGGLSGLWAQFFTSYNISFVIKLCIILMISTSIAIYVDTMEDLDRLMSLFIAGAVIITILEFFAVPADGWKNGSVGSYFSGNNPNDITVWIDFASAIAFYRAYVNGKKWMYPLVAVFIVFCAFSSSRKGLLASLAAPIMIVFLSVEKKNYFFRIITALAIGVVVLLVVMENDTLYTVIGRRFDSMIDYIMGEGKDGSMALRQRYIAAAKSMFSESPIIGKGMGNYSRILESEYYLGNFYSHNNYWQILSELGLIGFVIYFSMYVYCVVIFLRAYFVERRKISVLFITAITMMIVLDSGIISYSSKYGQLVIAIIYSATYAIHSDGGRAYSMKRQ